MTAGREAAAATASEFSIGIGGIPIRVRTTSPEFAAILADRYGSFVSRDTGQPDAFELDVDLQAPGPPSDDDVQVTADAGRWVMVRGDFRAEWDVDRRRGWVRQSINPYSIDCVLRILHSLILARQGGFLVHAASAIRNGKAFLFAGVSGAGKTTMARMAPKDVTLLTDEISYVRRASQGYDGYGTPFAGELARIGENVRAPLGALYLLEQGPEHRVEPVGKSEAAQALLRHILFFAHDAELVDAVFASVLDFVGRVPVKRLVFRRDAGAWDLVGG